MATVASGILSRVEELLMELKVHDDDQKMKQVLNLLDSLARHVAQVTGERRLARPSGEVIRSIADLITPLNVRISRIRMNVLSRKYEEALAELHVVESFEGGPEPGLMPLCSTVSALLNLSTQELTPEEVAGTVPEVMLTPPPDLLYGVPPVTVPLWNLLVRYGKLEKEETRRVLVPIGSPEQLERDFEEAWEALAEKGYAEMKVDRKGRVYLERRR